MVGAEIVFITGSDIIYVSTEKCLNELIEGIKDQDETLSVNTVSVKRVQAQNQSMWQPIDTAPRDRSRFLFSNGSVVGTGFFMTPDVFAADSWQGEKNTIPTHWMPLPELPRRLESI